MSKNYNWSDDDEENDIVPQPERLFPTSESESDEEYEDYTKLINEKINNCDINNKYNIEQNNRSVKEKVKENKIKINLWKTLQNPEQKKNWKSKRMLQKRFNDGKVEVKQRQFNPRLPIPHKRFFNDLKNSKKIINFNDNEFPELNI